MSGFQAAPTHNAMHQPPRVRGSATKHSLPEMSTPFSCYSQDFHCVITLGIFYFLLIPCTQFTLAGISRPMEWAVKLVCASVWDFENYYYSFLLLVTSCIMHATHSYYCNVRRDMSLNRYMKLVRLMRSIPFVLVSVACGSAYAYLFANLAKLSYADALFHVTSVSTQLNQRLYFVCAVGFITGLVYSCRYLLREEGHLRFPEEHLTFVFAVRQRLYAAILQAVPIAVVTSLLVMIVHCILPTSSNFTFLPYTTKLSGEQIIALSVTEWYYSVMVAFVLKFGHEMFELFRTSGNNRVVLHAARGVGGGLGGSGGTFHSGIMTKGDGVPRSVNAQELLNLMISDDYYTKYRAYELLQRSMTGAMEWGLMLLDRDDYPSSTPVVESWYTRNEANSLTPAIVLILRECLNVVKMQSTWVRAERESRVSSVVPTPNIANLYPARGRIKPVHGPTWSEAIFNQMSTILLSARLWLGHLLLGNHYISIAQSTPNQPQQPVPIFGVQPVNTVYYAEADSIGRPIGDDARPGTSSFGLMRTRPSARHESNPSGSSTPTKRTTPEPSTPAPMVATKGAGECGIIHSCVKMLPGTRYLFKSPPEYRTRAVFGDFQLVAWAVNAAASIAIGGVSHQFGLSKVLMRSGLISETINTLLECAEAVEFHNRDPMHDHSDPTYGIKSQAIKRQAYAMVQVLDRNLYMLANAYRKQIPDMEIKNRMKLAQYLTYAR
eukprot:CFRG0435T1